MRFLQPAELPEPSRTFASWTSLLKALNPFGADLERHVVAIIML